MKILGLIIGAVMIFSGGTTWDKDNKGALAWSFLLAWAGFMVIAGAVYGTH